jgi:glutamate decarboxylase
MTRTRTPSRILSDMGTRSRRRISEPKFFLLAAGAMGIEVLGTLRYVMETLMRNSRALATAIAEIGPVAPQPAAERGWRVAAYTLPPNAEHVTIMRALVKLTRGHGLATTLAADIAQACATLDPKGGLHELDRKRVKTGVGY